MPRQRMIDGRIVSEPLPSELPASHPAYLPPVVVPEVFGGHSVDPRDTRAAMERQILDHTDGTPAAREWASEKAANACRNWDRGVAEGSIQKH